MQSQRLRRGLNSHERATSRVPELPSRAERQSNVWSVKAESGATGACPSGQTNYLVLPFSHETPLAVGSAGNQPVLRAAAVAITVAISVRNSRGGKKARTTTVGSAEREAPVVVAQEDQQYCMHRIAGKPSVLPNPSLKLTRYGRLCKPGPRQSYYRRVPGLQSLPPRAA